MALYSIDVKCKCIKDCRDYGIEAGYIHKGQVELGRKSAPVYVVHCIDGKPIRCMHAWFAEYFELI